MEITSLAPSRIDLAGGTLDIWPLYLYHENSITVNAAINLYARAKIIPRRDKMVIVESKDTKICISADSIEGLNDFTELELLKRLILFFKPSAGFSLTTSSDIPLGSGLGGSSAMGIAVSSALNRLTGDRYNKEDIIAITRDIEGQVIKVPPGVQDYYPAVYGGVNAVCLSVGRVRAEPLSVDLKRLEERLIVYYTGMSRFSGSNNWSIMKDHIDGRNGLFYKMETIRDTALLMKEAIVSGNIEAIGGILAKEWENRKGLSKGVSTAEIEDIIGSAISFGADSVKVCGAGGGGCVVIFVKKGKREDVEKGLSKKEGRLLPFHIDTKGLTVASV